MHSPIQGLKALLSHARKQGRAYQSALAFAFVSAVCGVNSIVCLFGAAFAIAAPDSPAGGVPFAQMGAVSLAVGVCCLLSLAVLQDVHQDRKR